MVVLYRPGYKGGSGLGEVFAPVPAEILDSYSGVHAIDGVFAAPGQASAAESTWARATSSTSPPRC